MILDLTGDSVDVSLRSRSECSKVDTKFDLLETVKVGLNRDALDIEFLTQEIVIGLKIWSGNDPSFSTRKSLTTLCINTNTTACFGEFTDQGHLMLEFSIMWRELLRCSDEVLIPCISCCTFGRTRCAKWPCGSMNRFTSQVSMNGINHEWTYWCNQSTQCNENFVQRVLTSEFVP